MPHKPNLGLSANERSVRLGTGNCATIVFNLEPAFILTYYKFWFLLLFDGMHMKILLLMGIAGFVGTLFRYSVMRSINQMLPGFPWGTFAVNIIGAFLAGFCFVLCRSKFQHFEMYFPIFFIGFLGAFTTFSTFALESARYFANAQYVKFMGNVLLQNIIGIFAAGGGMWISKILFR